MQLTSALLTPQMYQLCVGEFLDDDVASWFGALTVNREPNGATILHVPVRDQTELHGLLIKVRDLNLTLISVQFVSPEICTLCDLAD